MSTIRCVLPNWQYCGWWRSWYLCKVFCFAVKDVIQTDVIGCLFMKRWNGFKYFCNCWYLIVYGCWCVWVICWNDIEFWYCFEVLGYWFWCFGFDGWFWFYVLNVVIELWWWCIWLMFYVILGWFWFVVLFWFWYLFSFYWVMCCLFVYVEVCVILGWRVGLKCFDCICWGCFRFLMVIYWSGVCGIGCVIIVCLVVYWWWYMRWIVCWGIFCKWFLFLRKWFRSVEVKYKFIYFIGSMLFCGVVVGFIFMVGCGDDNGGGDNNV